MNTTMRDIVYTTAIFGQMDDLIHVLEQDNTLKTKNGKVASDNEETSQEVLDSLNLVIRCANLSLAEIATDYVPLVVTEMVTVADGFLSFSNLSKNILDVVRITCKGMEIKFKFRPNGLVLPSGRYQIEYRYLPNATNFEDEIEYKIALISARIVAYGAIAEYFIISGLQDEAVLWDGRYRMALLNASTKTEKKIKRRRWSK